MKPRPQKRDPILLEVVAALGAGRIEFGSIHDEKEFVHGYTWPDGSIRINVSLDAVTTAIHECLHRMRPGWSERAVRAKTTRLLRQLSYPEIDTLYEILLATAARRKTPA